MVTPISSAVPALAASAEGSGGSRGRTEARFAEASRLLGAKDPALTSFFSGFTHHASPEDLAQFSGAERAALVRLVFSHTAKRIPGTPLVEIFDPSAEDAAFGKRGQILLAVNDDIPFLYDSGTAEVRAQGVPIIAAFHPVIALCRDAQGMRATSGTPLNESVIVLLLGAALDAPRAARLRDGLQTVFADARVAVRDWKAMLARLAETISGLKKNPPPIEEAELAENLSFLGWLANNHFTFLGARDYVFNPAGEGRLDAHYESGLGLLADPERRIVRRGADRSSLTPDVLEFLTHPAPIIITKSNARSTVHRHAHMDYVGVKTFDARGNLTGERRFVGLFTSSAYSNSPAAIPLLRRKVHNVLAYSGLPPASHDGKALSHVLEAFPRDELFQISEDELLSTALGILSLADRPKVRLFLRFDKFDRFVSALVFVPRERFNGAVRAKIHTLLANAFDGRESAATPMLDDEALARIHYIIGRNPGPRPERDVKELEAEIRTAIRTWEDGFAEATAQVLGEAAGSVLERYTGAFPASYRDTFSPLEAAADIELVEQVLEGRAACATLGAHVYGCEGDRPNALRLKLFARGGFVALSDCLPVFENLGLRVIAENAFALTPAEKDGKPAEAALQNFLMERADGSAADLKRVKPILEDAFHAVWAGRCESDGFNRLVVASELDWRDVAILRMLAKFLRQAGLMLSQAYMESALVKYPAIGKLLVELFRALHDPKLFNDAAPRKASAQAIRAKIEEALNDVPSADDDRIIRAMRSVVDASLRTSFFQPDANGLARPYIATKLDSRKLEVLPAPKPLYEIFVYSPEVEAIHLRFGKIARGGIRWSDRPEDFRTEILSLVKAQQVKNAVIVPVGAKGGFYPKRLPPGGTREEIQAAGISAYKLFIGAILDLTDNLGADGQVIPPKGVIRHDSDDPYLVVAADKGTASFSDIANGLAVERAFWLGDAFASGGSRGYDHKKMGITARGAWEAVKRHFREAGRDIQTEPFTCAGVGDMSGDVFGNAMLLSKATKLVAAFDHRHIFIDPSPDPAASWAERKRLFDLPRSSWEDYDASLISKGGGVYKRAAKDIALSQEAKAVTGLTKDHATPAELIRAILCSPVDLLFFGGIGTYIKASAQSHGDAGDRANDALRIDGRDVRAIVVGEGANLGVTQYGRIEYAREGGPERKGGHIDTDAIDNSAGVDTSDHEVNIKILMSGPLRRKELTEAGRDTLLAAMTDDVAALVLKDNYDQTLALSVAQANAVRDLDPAGRFMREMEREGMLDRAVEMLPSDDAMRALARQGLGLTRPELSVLLAYAKLEVFDSVTKSTLPGDPYFAHLLPGYFPSLAAHQFELEIPRHRLAREIVATQLVNRMVNLAGPLFAHRMRELSNTPLWCAARGFALADGAFGLSDLAARIGALDLKVPARTQIAMMGDIAELLRRLGLWFIVHFPATASTTETVETYARAFAGLKGRFAGLISPLETVAIEARIATFKQEGVPLDIAEDAGILPLLGAAPEIVLLSEQTGIPADTAASAYFAAGSTLALERLRALAGQIATADHWDRLALRRTVDDLYSAQRMLAAAALEGSPGVSKLSARGDGAAAVATWAKTREDDIGRTVKFLADLGHSGEPSIAKLALANSQIQKLAASAQT